MAQKYEINPENITTLPLSTPFQKISYGDNPSQFGELRLPNITPSTLYPLAIIMHGGCWHSQFASQTLMSPFAEALTNSGIITWNIEYRCSDNGGTFPNMFLDIANAVDFTHTLATQFPIDLKRVITVGHSSGGHLALWAAARHKLTQRSPIYTPNPLSLQAVVSLAGPGDLQKFRSFQRQSCGFNAVDEIFDNNLNNAAAWHDASPSELLPLNIQQLVITGDKDKDVTPAIIMDYFKQAQKAGDSIEAVILPDCGHFDYLKPSTNAFAAVRDKINDILGSTKQDPQ